MSCQSFDARISSAIPAITFTFKHSTVFVTVARRLCPCHRRTLRAILWPLQWNTWHHGKVNFSFFQNYAAGDSIHRRISPTDLLSYDILVPYFHGVSWKIDIGLYKSKHFTFPPFINSINFHWNTCWVPSDVPSLEGSNVHRHLHPRCER